MALPDFTMRQLLEAGAHFGHQTHRWNPKMERFIFGARSNIHIIDLSQSMPLLHQALVKAREVAAHFPDADDAIGQKEVEQRGILFHEANGGSFLVAAQVHMHVP